MLIDEKVVGYEFHSSTLHSHVRKKLATAGKYATRPEIGCCCRRGAGYYKPSLTTELQPQRGAIYPRGEL